MRQHPVVAPVIGLLNGRRPTTIARRVMAVNVLPLDRHPVRPRPHVGDEVGIVLPPRANLNATASVISEARVVRVSAAFDHRVPYFVNRIPGPTMLRDGFAEQTPARFNAAGRKRAAGDCGRHSAIAPAMPKALYLGADFTFARERGDRKPMETTSDEVFGG